MNTAEQIVDHILTSLIVGEPYDTGRGLTVTRMEDGRTLLDTEKDLTPSQIRKLRRIVKKGGGIINVVRQPKATNDNTETLASLVKSGVIRTTPKHTKLSDMLEQGTVRTSPKAR